MFQIFKTFVSVYETHNFTRTADKLYLSQPTVSSQIKKLEEQLQVSLFIRNGKQEIIPTKEADFLYPRIIKIMEECMLVGTCNIHKVLNSLVCIET